MKIKELPLNTAVERFFTEAEKNGLERREGQIEMSKEVTQAIIDNNSLVVEAEVGIGKSFAYLVPIILQFFRERRQVVIATSTIALQEQLEHDVNTVLDMIGVKTKVEVAKGMKNYISVLQRTFCNVSITITFRFGSSCLLFSSSSSRPLPIDFASIAKLRFSQGSSVSSYILFCKRRRLSSRLRYNT